MLLVFRKEIFDVRVKNTSDRERHISVTGYVEFSFHNIDIDNQNFQMSLYCAGSFMENDAAICELHYEPDSFQFFAGNFTTDGYEGTRGIVTMRAIIDGATLSIEILDRGKGIPNVQQAMEPFYTTHPEQERSGMGFAVMQTFMDEVDVQSTPGSGTLVRMRKRIRQEAQH